MKLYDQVQNGALDRVNARLKNIKFFATAGPHRIGVAFKRRTFAESDDQLQMFARGGGQDRLYRVNSFQLRGPFDAKGLSPTPSRARIFSLPPGAAAGASSPDGASEGGMREADHRVAGEARLPPAGHRRGRERAVPVLPGRREGRRLRGRHPQRGHRPAGEPVLPVSQRARPGRSASRATYAISDLELASKLSFFLWNSIPDDQLLQLAIDGKLSTPTRARPAGAAHAGRSALGHAGEQLRPPVARHEAPGRDRAGLGGVPVCVGPIRSARGFPHRADAVRRQPLQGRPQRRRSAAGEAHVSQRARRAALRHHRREGRSLPARRARAVGALGAARQRRGADGGGLSEPHVAGAARRVRPQAHSGRAAGARRRPTCRRWTRRTSARRGRSRCAR